MRQIKLRAIFSLAATMLLGGAIPAALAQTPKARPGEIVVKVPSNMDPVALAKTANCEVIRPVAYCEGYYLFGTPNRNQQLAEEAPKADLLNAVATLRQVPGVIAEPNWMVYPAGYKPQAKVLKPGVSRVQQPPGTGIVPNDALYSRQKWHMDMIRMPETWNIQYGDGTPVIVSIIDSGIDAAHPDFKDAAGVSRIVAQQDFSGSTSINIDTIGHGTHVAGTVAATTNNTTGVVGVAGWNHQGLNVKLINAKVFDAAGTSSAAIASAINYSIAQGARVINMSIQSVGSVAPQVQVDAVNSAISAGVVVVASAGNSNNDNDNPNTKDFPSDIPGVIKVISVGPTKTKASYSNYGGNLKKIAAPGGDGAEGGPDAVWSTVPLAGSQVGPAGGYWSINGTSMAAPHVAGAAAILMAAGVPAANVYQAMADTASLAADGVNVKVYGPGVLDVYSALYPFSDPPPSMTLEGGSDRGNSYFGATPISLTLRGVGRIYQSGPPSGITGLWSLESDINVEIQTVGRTPTIVKSFTGGRSVLGQTGKIEIPVLPANASKSTVYNRVRVPASNANGTYSPVALSPGQYRIVARLTLRNTTGIVSTTEQVQFITIVEKQLSAGRTMFAMPFKAGVATLPAGSSVTPEAAVLGQSTVFGLSRYNPLRTPSDDDYARFRSADLFNLQNAARFAPANQLDKRVVTFDTTAPSLSLSPIGMGYWLDLDRAGAVNTTLLPYPGQISGVSPIAENSVGIKVYATGGGWNMIGAPFTYPVDWSVVTVRADGVSYSIAEAVKAGIISPALIGFGNGDYVYSIAPGGQLSPFNGYWVRAFRDCELNVPPVPTSEVSGAGRSLTSAVPQGGWQARIIASVGNGVDGQNYFGQRPGAAEGEDLADIPKPPAGASDVYVTLMSKGANGKSRALAFDMRPLSGTTVNQEEWVAAVQSARPNAQVVLSWDGIRSAPRNARFVLTDLQTGAVVQMGSRSSYTYQSGEAGSTHRFVVKMLPQASGVLAIRNLKTGSTTRAAAGLTVRFNTNLEADTQVSITTTGGREIRTLATPSRVQAGTEVSLYWDGRGKDGSVVPAGPYVIRVSAKTSDGQQQNLQRVVQILK